MGCWPGPSEQNRKEDMEARMKRLEDLAFSFHALHQCLMKDQGYRNLDAVTRNWVDMTYSEYCRAMKLI